MKKQLAQTGFTTIEVIVVILVAASFIASISQMISYVSNTAQDAHREEVARNLAYNNMRIYANGQPAIWFICSAASNGVQSPNGTGHILINTTSFSPVNGLPAPVRQKVTAFAPYGCGDDGAGMPVRILSEVSYGNPAQEAVHATYVGY